MGRRKTGFYTETDTKTVEDLWGLPLDGDRKPLGAAAAEWELMKLGAFESNSALPPERVGALSLLDPTPERASPQAEASVSASVETIIRMTV